MKKLVGKKLYEKSAILSMPINRFNFSVKACVCDSFVIVFPLRTSQLDISLFKKKIPTTLYYKNIQREKIFLVVSQIDKSLCLTPIKYPCRFYVLAFIEVMTQE